MQPKMTVLICRASLFLLVSSSVLVTDCLGQSRLRNKRPHLRKPDVIFVPTPPETVEEMLRLAKIKKGDVLYDLGSGDGRIPIRAAQEYGIRAVGIDIDPKMIDVAKQAAAQAGVGDKVQFRNEDLFQ